MTALDRATRKLIRVARRWRLAQTQDALTQRLCAEHLDQTVLEHFVVEFNAMARALKRRRRSK